MSPRPVIKKVMTVELGPKSWGSEVLFAHTETYIGKILRMNKGSGGPLQYHRTKDETFCLLDGRARVTYHTADGATRRVTMYAGESYHVPPGAVHQVEALSDCIFIEASNPVFDDRVAVDE